MILFVGRFENMGTEQKSCRSRKKKAPRRYDVRLIDRITKTHRVKRCRRVEREGHRSHRCQPIPYRNCFSVLLRQPADTSPRSRQDQLPFRFPMIDLSYFDEYQRGPVTQGIYWPSWLSDSISLLGGEKRDSDSETSLFRHADTLSPAGFVRSARRQSSRHPLARIFRDIFVRSDKGYPSNRTAASTAIVNAPKKRMKKMVSGRRAEERRVS